MPKQPEQTTLYLIGGASRSGKTILVEKLLDKYRIPYIPTDALQRPMKVARDLNPDLSKKQFMQRERDKDFVEHAKDKWPIIQSLIENVSQMRDFALEGEVFLPKYLHEIESKIKKHLEKRAKLRKQKPAICRVKVCFLGYTDIDLDKKVEEVMEFSDYNAWISRYSRIEITGMVKKRIEFSKYIQAGCKQYNLPYIDTSFDFHESLEKAATSLVS